MQVKMIAEVRMKNDHIVTVNFDAEEAKEFKISGQELADWWQFGNVYIFPGAAKAIHGFPALPEQGASRIQEAKPWTGLVEVTAVARIARMEGSTRRKGNRH